MGFEIKICGITNQEDASLAAESGATMLGFIFAKSARQVLVEEVARISTPNTVRRIGVFADASVADVLRAVEIAKLDGAQLHGSESREYVRELKAEAPGLHVIKAVTFETFAADFDCDSILLDKDKASKGPLDIARAAKLKTAKPLLIAGGFDSELVAQAIEQVHPQGVDVCSGVESAPGRKDPAKVRAFIASAMRASQKENQV